MKKVNLGKESRIKLLNGIRILNDAVSSTLGPYGRNVTIEKENGIPHTTKDGVTVAEAIHLEDPQENMGVQLIRQASVKTNNQSGDGTTTSTLLASKLVELGMETLEKKDTNVTQLKRELYEAAQIVKNYLVDHISKNISDKKQLEQIANISANNSKEIGKLVATALENVGKDGIVDIEESKTGSTYIENVEGVQFDRGYKSPYLVTDNDSMAARLENPLILMIDGKLSKINEVVHVLEKISTEGRSLLIIADDIENEALAALVVNKQRGALNVCAVKSPDYGERRKLILEDIAISTGGKVFSPEKGMKFDNFSWEWFGEARIVNVTKDDTTIIDGKGDEDEIKERIISLKNQIDLPSATSFMKEHLQTRLARFAGGVAIIHVGGLTESEMKERKDRVTDALHATRAALQEGILPGGGVALLKCLQPLEKLDTEGASILKYVITSPFRTIYRNAGVDDNNIENYIHNIQLVDDPWESINPLIDTSNVESDFCNLLEEGILDPTKVTKNALLNAVSIASTILLTECTITNLENKQPQNQNMGMMGGMM